MADAIRAIVPDADLPLDKSEKPPLPVSGILDITAIARDTGYAPQYDLRRAMAEYVDWVRAHGY
jgi:nucleoside-diphosphate-sugar epimerase